MRVQFLWIFQICPCLNKQAEIIGSKILINEIQRVKVATNSKRLHVSYGFIEVALKASSYPLPVRRVDSNSLSNTWKSDVGNVFSRTANKLRGNWQVAGNYSRLKILCVMHFKYSEIDLQYQWWSRKKIRWYKLLADSICSRQSV